MYFIITAMLFFSGTDTVVYTQYDKATFDSNVIITRCTNNFGPRQFPEKLIPKIILLAKLDKNIPIYGSGKNIRDWIYVDEHCDAIFRVLMKGKSGQSYNISGNTEISNLQITNYILEKMNKSKDLIKFVDDRPGQLARVAETLSDQAVSIATVSQTLMEGRTAASLILTTHDTNEHSIGIALEKLENLPGVLEAPVLFRMFDPNGKDLLK